MVEYIGLDIGGTNIKIGAIDTNENLIFSYKEPTFDNVSIADDLYKKIVNLIKRVPDYKKAKAIGIGLPGSIDLNTNKIITLRNVSLLKDYPLMNKLSLEFKMPIYFENDGRIAALAEAIKGRGKDKKIVCYVTISTGLGGGIVIDKQIYNGAYNLGGYFSRIILDGENTSDYLISGTKLCEQAKNKMGKEIKNVFEIFEMEKLGNEDAIEIINQFKKNLTVLLLNISSTFNPDIIILGGGVINAKERFINEVIEKFRLKAHPLAKNTIIETKMFDEPGIVGAGLFAKQNFEKFNL